MVPGYSKLAFMVLFAEDNVDHDDEEEEDEERPE